MEKLLEIVEYFAGIRNFITNFENTEKNNIFKVGHIGISNKLNYN